MRSQAMAMMAQLRVALSGRRWPGLLVQALSVLLGAWIIVHWPPARAAALLAGVGAGLAILIWPVLGFPLLAFAVPFGSLGSANVGLGSVGLAELLLGMIAASWLLRQLSRRTLRLSWPSFAGAGALLLVAMLVSFLPATELGAALKEIVKWAELWVAALLVLNLAEMQGALLLALGLLAAGAAEGLLGVHQSVAQTGPEGFFLVGQVMRASGTFQQPNPYGGYLGLSLPLAAGLLLTAWPGRSVARGRRFRLAVWLVAALAGGLMLAGLFASQSRGGWLGAAAAMGAVALAHGGRPLRGALLVGAVGILLSLVLWGRLPIPGALEQRFAGYAVDFTTLDVRSVEVTDANFALVERVAHWQAAWAMFSERPWTGVGLGNYAATYARYALPRWQDPLGHAHNYYLNMLAETGLPGLAAYLLWVAAGLWVSIRAVQVSRGLGRGLALGALGMCVHLGVHSAFDNLYVHAMSIHVGLLLGLAALSIRFSAPGGSSLSASENKKAGSPSESR